MFEGGNVTLKRGQVTVLVLLLGILGLTVGLSVVSRSLSDLKQASYVDFGTKALAAAETGAEYALNQISSPSFSSANLSTQCNTATPSQQQVYDAANPAGNKITLDASTGVQSVYYSICPDSSGYSQKSNVAKDEVHQVDLNTPGSGAWTSNIRVIWQSPAAVEVSVLYQDLSGAYTIKRFAYNSSANTVINAATGTLASSNDCLGTTLPVGSTWYRVPADLTGTNAIQVRVRPIGNSSSIFVCGATPLPGQFYTVISKAVTTNGTVKRVQVTRDIFGHLPSVFDNVIYSGGSLVK